MFNPRDADLGFHLVFKYERNEDISTGLILKYRAQQHFTKYCTPYNTYRYVTVLFTRAHFATAKHELLLHTSSKILFQSSAQARVFVETHP